MPMDDGVPPWLVDDPKEIAALWSGLGGITSDDQPPTTQETREEWRRMTGEEWDLYHKTLEESEGFDTIDLAPNVVEFGIHVPLLVSEEEEPDKYADLIEDSRSALEKYNNENGTNFEVVKVLKANCHFIQGARTYITFQAEDKATASFGNFQAIVYVFIGVNEVQLVRLEPKKSQLLQENDKEARLDLPSKEKAGLGSIGPNESKCTPGSLHSSL